MESQIKIISKEEYLKNHKKPSQEKVWDNIAESTEKRDFFKIREIDSVKDFLKDKKGKIVDLGCGSGWNMISNPDVEYYGVDISKKSLELAKKRAKEKKIKVSLFRGNVTRLDKSIFKKEMFGYGMFIACLHCIEGEKNRENALKEFYRILKKRGEGLITVWKSDDPRFNSAGNHGDVYMSWKEGKKTFMRYYYLYFKDEFLDLLRSVGFEIVEIYKTDDDRFSKKNWIVRVKKNS